MPFSSMDVIASTVSRARLAFAGRFHLVLAEDTSDPRIGWIATHCQDVTKAAGGPLKSYFCVPADAPG